MWNNRRQGKKTLLEGGSGQRVHTLTSRKNKNSISTFSYCPQVHSTDRMIINTTSGFERTVTSKNFATLHLMPRSRMRRAIPPLPQYAFMASFTLLQVLTLLQVINQKYLYGRWIWSLTLKEERNTAGVWEQGAEEKKLAGGWRKLHNEELYDLYASLNIIRVIKSRRMRQTGQVARMGEITNAWKFSSDNLRGRDLSEELCVDGRIILKWILGKLGGKA